MTYSVEQFGAMIADDVRMTAYDQALRQAITPNSIVLDIGAGTGIFSLLACRYGAKRVYAVDPNKAIVVAKEIARDNGYADRITFIEDVSTAIALDEPATVVISDLRTFLPLYTEHIPSIIDARQRHLAPNGVMIPMKDTVIGAIVDSPELFQRQMVPWFENVYDLDMKAGRKIVTNSWRATRAEPNQLLVEPQVWAVLDYRTIEHPNVRGELAWQIERDGTGYGFVLWFDAELMSGIGFSNSPHEPELIYKNTFFPWTNPVSLKKGDTVKISVEARVIDGEYAWIWNSKIYKGTNCEQPTVKFNQSTLLSELWSPTILQTKEATYTPQRTKDVQIDQLILSEFNGAVSLKHIAEELAQSYPEQFTSWQDAMPRVSKIAGMYECTK